MQFHWIKPIGDGRKDGFDGCRVGIPEGDRCVGHWEGGSCRNRDAMLGSGAFRHRHGDADIGIVGVGGKSFGAVENPVVAGFHRGGAG